MFSEEDAKVLERLIKSSGSVKRLSKKELFAEMQKFAEELKKKEEPSTTT